MSPRGSERSDKELLLAYREGDIHAFEQLLTRHRTVLFNYLLRRVRDRGHAEELYQDVWMRVIERAGDFRGESKFATWLYTIARNRCIDHHRRMSFRRHQSLDAPDPRTDEPRGERIAALNPGTARAAESTAIRAKIAAAVERLPDEQRDVFVMRQIQGLAFRDIAEVAGVPLNTVKSRMRYALERLQAELADFEEHARGS